MVKAILLGIKRAQKVKQLFAIYDFFNRLPIMLLKLIKWNNFWPADPNSFWTSFSFVLLSISQGLLCLPAHGMIVWSQDHNLIFTHQKHQRRNIFFISHRNMEEKQIKLWMVESSWCLLSPIIIKNRSTICLPILFYFWQLTNAKIRSFQNFINMRLIDLL